MKSTNAALISLLLTMPLIAASTNSGHVTFDHAVTVSGTKVPAGRYRVQWEGSGPSVKASIIQGKSVIATAPATLIMAKSSYDHAVETQKEGDNSEAVTSIEWRNRSLHFDQATSPSTTGAAVK